MRIADVDIVVVGGGHAGVEAAYAVARMGKRCALVTMDAARLALMSCNPAIGGIAKSHVVKEVDALGGVMGLATDMTGIQFRRLNLSRGAAVWSTRVQCDRNAYNSFICDFIANQPLIEVVEAAAGWIVTENRRVVGVKTETGEHIGCRAAIVATGTFLGGLIHIGDKQIEAGRIGEPAAYQMSACLDELGFELGRLKTGTPPRIDGDTIDFDRCTLQPGDTPAPMFSARSRRTVTSQVPCYLTNTTADTKRLIEKNASRSAMFSGQIKSTGPRYCPSIEDKFHRFADKETHQIFLEPEGNGTNEIYPNGFSTALPEDVQREAIRTITGLEEARIVRPGYAIEYDYCPAHQIGASLETKGVSRLYFAGQINGTSGYEEAAGQGLIAGVNASLALDQEPPLILSRSEAYIGVMIDDLTTRSTTEPYRLFTSRAEYRLAIREDNARDRLHRYAERYGLLDSEELQSFSQLKELTDVLVRSLEKTRVKVRELGDMATRFKRRESLSLAGLLRQPGMTLEAARPYLLRSGDRLAADPEVLERAAIIIQYSGYIDKQFREIEKFRRLEAEMIPSDFDYNGVKGLKKEAHEKFLRFQPRSLGQAGRIEGVTPGDVAVLSVFLKRHKEAR